MPEPHKHRARTPKRNKTAKPPKPPAPPRWTTKAHNFTANPPNIQIRFDTDVPNHCWLYVSEIKPSIHRASLTTLGITRPHHIAVNFPGSIAYEQIAPGNTLYHIFEIPAVVGEHRIYYVMVDDLTPSRGHSVGPIFCLHYDYTEGLGNEWILYGTPVPGHVYNSRDVAFRIDTIHGTVFPPPAQTAADLFYSLIYDVDHGDAYYSLFRAKMAANPAGFTLIQDVGIITTYFQARAAIQDISFSAVGSDPYQDVANPHIAGSFAGSATANLPSVSPTRDILMASTNFHQGIFQLDSGISSRTYHQNADHSDYQIINPNLNHPPVYSGAQMSLSSSYPANPFPFGPTNYLRVFAHALRATLSNFDPATAYFLYIVDNTRDWRDLPQI